MPLGLLKTGMALALLLVCAAAGFGQENAPRSPQAERVRHLLVQLSEQAAESDDLTFATRAQSRAALLLWHEDRDMARSILRRAFEDLRPANAALDEDPELRLQLRAELLNQIASRDADLTEEMARALVNDLSKPAATAGESKEAMAREAAARRELLMSVALRLVERDPLRAMLIGQLSLNAASFESGEEPLISVHFARLLALLRAADARLADTLLLYAIERLERAASVNLADLHSLGSYLMADAGAAGKGVAARFLNLALDRMTRRQATAGRADDAAAYFLGRQLRDLMARYLPDRLGQLQGVLNDSAPVVGEIDPSSMQSDAPAELVREAESRADSGERDALFARAAFAWMARGEWNEAQTAASRIAEAEIRDRVLAQLARRRTVDGNIEDALAAAGAIADQQARASALIRLARAAWAARDRVRAAELLDEAAREAVRAPLSVARAQSLLEIVGCFVAFDPVRAFEVMQTAVKDLNELAAAEAENRAGPAASTFRRLNFEDALAALSGHDFDRALLLAQQLSHKQLAVAAQLAVCRGGLTMTATRRPLSGDDLLPDAP